MPQHSIHCWGSAGKSVSESQRWGSRATAAFSSSRASTSHLSCFSPPLQTSSLALSCLRHQSPIHPVPEAINPSLHPSKWRLTSQATSSRSVAPPNPPSARGIIPESGPRSHQTPNTSFGLSRPSARRSSICPTNGTFRNPFHGKPSPPAKGTLVLLATPRRARPPARRAPHRPTAMICTTPVFFFALRAPRTLRSFRRWSSAKHRRIQSRTWRLVTAVSRSRPGSGLSDIQGRQWHLDLEAGRRGSCFTRRRRSADRGHDSASCGLGGNSRVSTDLGHLCGGVVGRRLGALGGMMGNLERRIRTAEWSEVTGVEGFSGWGLSTIVYVLRVQLDQYSRGGN